MFPTPHDVMIPFPYGVIYCAWGTNEENWRNTWSHPVAAQFIAPVARIKKTGAINCAATGIFGEHGAIHCATTIFIRQTYFAAYPPDQLR